MLCGLLPATSGTLRVAGADLRTSRAEARQRLGYVAQKFSLYGQLSRRREPRFLRRRLRLARRAKRERIAWAKQQFELERFARCPADSLPGGYKQRLAMAAALLHEPEILFLDEPTSGADPLARREFWGRITALAEQGVTVIVTTHFMEEAEYCDRIVILDAGRALAEGTPAEIRAHARADDGQEPNMEDAFIAIVEAVRATSADPAARRPHDGSDVASQHVHGAPAPHRRADPQGDRQVVRDPSSIAVGIVMPMVLLVLFGYGLSFDVKNVPVALVMEDHPPTRRGAVSGFELSDISTRVLVKTMAEAGSCCCDKSRRHRAHPARLRPRLEPAMRKSRSSSMAPTPNGAHLARLCAGRGRHVAGARRRAGDASLAGAPIDAADAALVQRGQREHLFPGAGADRAGHDADRRAADGAGDGARMGARHIRGAVRHARPPERDPARQDVPYFVLGMIGLGALGRSAARLLFGVPLRGSLLDPGRRCRCSICWWRWASAC